MKELLQQLDRWVDDHKAEMIADITELVAIPSKRGPAAENAPYGAECARAVDAAMAMCEKYGFAVTNYDYRVCTADMGDRPARLDILAHLDVVDEGTGWLTDPYTVVEKDGCLFGRGTSDDKGPAVTALYAMRAVRDLGLPLTGGVRLILGSDEECGSSDLVYYFQREKSAPHSFTPDSNFPVLNTEKGRFRPTFSCAVAPETALPRVAAIQSGVAANVVPETATALVLGLEAAEAEKLAAGTAAACGVALTVTTAEGGCELTVKGLSAHGAWPQRGNNAATALVAILTALPLANLPSTARLKALAQLLPHGDVYGKALGITMEDEVSGPLTFGCNLLSLQDGKLSATADCRFPICGTKETVCDPACARLEAAGFQVEPSLVAPHHVPEESPFIQTLLNAYETVTGQKGFCLSTGGGTYVHDIEGGVAFGPQMPGVETNLHSANENIPLGDLLSSIKMFALAIAEICK